MAIYHLTAKTLSRDKHSALAKADYITRSGKYAADHCEVLFTSRGNMPTWGMVDNTYWKAADEYERANGRLCKEIEFALPRELSLDQMIDLVEDFIQDVATSKDGPLPYTYSIHRGQFGENPHCHAIFSERVNDNVERRPEIWFKRANSKSPERGGAKKTESLKPKEWLFAVREVWAELANSHLEEAGRSERIDHRSYQNQGLDQIPTVHEGVYATKLEREGIASKRGNWNRRIREENERKRKKAQTQDATDAQTQIAVSTPLDESVAAIQALEAALEQRLEMEEAEAGQSLNRSDSTSKPADKAQAQGQQETAASMPPKKIEAEQAQTTPSPSAARPTGGVKETQKKTPWYKALFAKKKQPQPEQQVDETVFVQQDELPAPEPEPSIPATPTTTQLQPMPDEDKWKPLDETQAEENDAPKQDKEPVGQDDELVKYYTDRFNAAEYISEKEDVIRDIICEFKEQCREINNYEMMAGIIYSEEEKRKPYRLLELGVQLFHTQEYMLPDILDEIYAAQDEIDDEIRQQQELAEQFYQEAENKAKPTHDTDIVLGTKKDIGTKKGSGMGK